MKQKQRTAARTAKTLGQVCHEAAGKFERNLHGEESYWQKWEDVSDRCKRQYQYAALAVAAHVRKTDAVRT